MIRKLLLLVMLFGVAQISNAQTIDVIGTGTLGVTGLANRNLSFTDVDNITRVDVGVTFKEGLGIVPNPTDVQFSDADEGPLSIWKTQPDLIVKHFSPSFGEIVGYFEGTFNTADAGGVNVSIIPFNDTPSFYAFVHRDDPNATYKSYISPEVSFYFRNGSNDPYVYSVPINTASSSRNIKVKVPISELDDGLVRKAIFDITAGSVTEHVEVNLFNLGNSFFLGEYTLENVPGDVDEVTVSVYSPNDLEGEDPGDSFFVNGIVVDVDIVNDDPGCTLTKGYWKTHTKYDGDKKYDDTWAKIQPDGEDSPFFSSYKSYYEVLKRAPRGNPYYILACQYIAAELNFLNGADPTDAQEAFDKAKRIFERFTPGQVMYKIRYGGRNGKKLKKKIVRLAKRLDEYNNGYIGPGHCDGDEEEKECLTSDDVRVTPNPINSYGEIKFTATCAAKTKVYLFNSYGQPICPLFYEWVEEGEEVKIHFNARRYRNGTYYIKIWNGDCVVVKRIVIQCY